MAGKKKQDQFEDAIKKLQAIVEKLERGDLPLEEAMEGFTEGMQLAKFCHLKLEEAENKVQLLLKEQDKGCITAPFTDASAVEIKD